MHNEASEGKESVEIKQDIFLDLSISYYSDISSNRKTQPNTVVQPEAFPSPLSDLHSEKAVSLML